MPETGSRGGPTITDLLLAIASRGIFPWPVPLLSVVAFSSSGGCCASGFAVAVPLARFFGIGVSETAVPPAARLPPRPPRGAGVWQEDGPSATDGSASFLVDRSYSIGFRLSPKDLRSVWACSSKTGGQASSLRVCERLHRCSARTPEEQPLTAVKSQWTSAASASR